MPCSANPQAISRKGLLGPNVSSRSFGPEPCTRISTGRREPPLGRVNVPGSRKVSVEISTLFSSNLFLLNFIGLASTTEVAGVKVSVLALPSSSNTTVNRIEFFSKRTSQWYIVIPSAISVFHFPRDLNSPICFSNCRKLSLNTTGATFLRMVSLIRTCTLSPCPATINLYKRSALFKFALWFWASAGCRIPKRTINNITIRCNMIPSNILINDSLISSPPERRVSSSVLVSLSS